MNGNQTDVPGAVRFYDLLKKLKHELQEVSQLKDVGVTGTH
jgi:hypothetical protein